ncbi:MAG: T9SS type A sorting domain-containing protein, partial [Chitinophagales bacterium]
DFTLFGDNPDLAYLGESYNDPGVLAEDCVDGALSVDTTTTANTTARDTVDVVYEATDGSGNTSTTTRTVYVNTEPDPDFDYTVNGATVNLTDESRYNPTNWKWTVTNASLPTRSTRNTNYNFSENGIFEVCLEVGNEWNARFGVSKKQLCQDVEIVGVGINEIELNEIFTLYPNPTEAIVNINYSSSEIKNLNISVFNLVGKEILNQNFSNAANAATLKLDLSGNADGLYLVRIQTDKGVITKRVNLFNK